MTTTNVSAAAQEQLHQAQRVIDEHLVVTVAGRCQKCGEVAPCSAHVEASKTFARCGRLPKRTLWATMPENLRRVA